MAASADVVVSSSNEPTATECFDAGPVAPQCRRAARCQPIHEDLARGVPRVRREVAAVVERARSTGIADLLDVTDD